MGITLKALISKITEAEKVSETTARRRIKKMLEAGELVESEHSTKKIRIYRMVDSTESMINNIKTGGKKMSKPELKENFVIGARDCTQWKYGKKVKPAAATEEVVAVKGKKEKKDDDGNIVQEAVKAVKAVPAKPATNGSIQIYFKAVSEEVAQEAVTRLIHEGLEPDNADQNGNAVFYDKKFKHWFFSFTHEKDRVLRDAFKAVKAKDDYNAPGLAILKAEKKAAEKAKKEAEAKKEAAKSEPKGNVKSGKTEPEDSSDADSDDEWPE